MRRNCLWGACLLYALGIVLIDKGPRDYPEYRQAEAIGQKIIQETQSLLLKAVSDKGPAEVLTECSAVTNALAQQYEPQGWRIRRVSQKARNPANAPDVHEAKILKDYETLKAVGRLKPEVPTARIKARNGKRDLHYMQPILITSQVCLQCHGQPDSLSPEVKTRLRALYPRDRATGYQLNDLLGAVSIDVPLPDL